MQSPSNFRREPDKLGLQLGELLSSCRWVVIFNFTRKDNSPCRGFRISRFAGNDFFTSEYHKANLVVVPVVHYAPSRRTDLLPCRSSDERSGSRSSALSCDAGDPRSTPLCHNNSSSSSGGGGNSSGRPSAPASSASSSSSSDIDLNR